MQFNQTIQFLQIDIRSQWQIWANSQINVEFSKNEEKRDLTCWFPIVLCALGGKIPKNLQL